MIRSFLEFLTHRLFLRSTAFWFGPCPGASYRCFDCSPRNTKHVEVAFATCFPSLLFALDVADVLSTVDHPGFGSKSFLPDWSKEIDYEIDRWCSTRNRQAERAYNGLSRWPLEQRSHALAMRDGSHPSGVAAPPPPSL